MGTQKIDWNLEEQYCPNYYSCSTITMIDILTRVKDGELILSRDQTCIEGLNVEVVRNKRK